MLAALEEQLQKSRLLLRVWEVYDLRAASLSQQLQTLQSEAGLMLSGDPADGDGVEQVAVLTQQVQVRKNKAKTGCEKMMTQRFLPTSRDLN